MCSRFQKVRTSSPAPVIRSSDNATCATTRPFPNTFRWRPPNLADPVLRAKPGSTPVEPSAGASPRRMPVEIDNAAVKAATRKSSLRSSPIENSRGSSELPHTASSIPTEPPSNPSSVLSVSSCRSTRTRDAPIDSRMAISFRRAVARDSRRLARLAQTMSSTTPTIAINTRRGVVKPARSSLNPRPPGCSSRRLCRNSRRSRSSLLNCRPRSRSWRNTTFKTAARLCGDWILGMRAMTCSQRTSSCGSHGLRLSEWPEVARLPE